MSLYSSGGHQPWLWITLRLYFVSNFVGDIPCNIITGGGRTAEGLANSWRFGNYQESGDNSLESPDDDDDDEADSDEDEDGISNLSPSR